MSRKLTTRQHAVKSRTKPARTPSPERTPAGDALSGLIIQILQLHGLLTAAGDALAAPAGQTAARWHLLAAVDEEPHSVADIARGMNLARQSVQRVADLLEEDGLAVFEENPAHQRAKLLRLTPQGRAALGEIQAAQRVWVDGLAAGLGEANCRRASALLESLKEALLAQATPEESAAVSR